MSNPDIFQTLQIVEKTTQNLQSEIYLVGGYLRDLFLNKPTKDIDFALNKNAKSAAEKTAKYFKCAMVSLEEEREIYRVFVHPELQLDFAKFKGSTIQEDLSNRDFSINAMAVPLGRVSSSKFQVPSFKDQILDPFHAQEDLTAKIVRQISPDIYEDDPLRLLRAYRIASNLDFKIDSQTIQDIQKNKKKIHASAVERIREELLLLLDPPNAYPYVLELDQSGLISELFPEMDPNRTCALQYYPSKGVWGHSLDGLKYLEWIFQNLKTEFPENHEKIASFIFSEGNGSEGHPRSTLMKAAILLHDIGKAQTAAIIRGRMHFYEHQNVGARMTEKIAKRLKFSSKAGKFLAGLVQHHMRPGSMAVAPNITDKAKYRFFRDLELSAIPMLIVSLADHYTYIPNHFGKNTDPHEKFTKDIVQWHYQKELDQAHKKPKLLDGNMLMEKLNLQPGPLIGQILKEVDEAVVTGEIQTPEQALEYAKRILER